MLGGTVHGPPARRNCQVEQGESKMHTVTSSLDTPAAAELAPLNDLVASMPLSCGPEAD